MDVFLGEWVNLLLRWAHMVVGIGWIGTSFYFMALDYSLNRNERSSEGVLGAAWPVHGGGFYHVEKYTVAPERLPETLHWFKWEAYTTWLSGFGLFIAVYYSHASSYLVDKSVAEVTALVDRVMILVKGQTVFEGKPQALHTSPEIMQQHLGV